MKVSEMKKQVAALREERDGLHEKLHAVLADESVTVSQMKAQERAIRQRIKEINTQCFPMEVIVAKVKKVLKGTELIPEEQAIFDDAVAQVGSVEF